MPHDMQPMFQAVSLPHGQALAEHPAPRQGQQSKRRAAEIEQQVYETAILHGIEGGVLCVCRIGNRDLRFVKPACQSDTDIKSILIIGAGPIVIGQACEFDYSGAQACKALREEGYRVILVNSIRRRS